MITSENNSTAKSLNELYKQLEGSINPTEVYNEGWMLKCVLKQKLLGDIICHDNETKWHTEALLPTFFKLTPQKKSVAEKDTHADAIIGHISFREDTKRGVKLNENCTCLYVIEAKMYSTLSKGVKNDSKFDQCSRSVACLMKLVYNWLQEDNKRKVEDIKNIGFYLIAPEDQKDKLKIEIEKDESSFDDITGIKDKIKYKINKRIKTYDPSIEQVYLARTNENLDSFIDRIEIKLITWEELVGEGESEIKTFYANCIEYNKPSNKIKK